MEKIYLSERDWEFLMEALENPPEPNEALKALMRENYEQIIQHNGSGSSD